MKKYIKVVWPEIQYYMTRSDYQEEVSYDPDKDCWFVPEDWEPVDFLGLCDDLEDAMG